MLAIVTNVTIIYSKVVVKVSALLFFFVAVIQYFKFRTFYCLVRLNFNDY